MEWKTFLEMDLILPEFSGKYVHHARAGGKRMQPYAPVAVSVAVRYVELLGTVVGFLQGRLIRSFGDLVAIPIRTAGPFAARGSVFAILVGRLVIMGSRFLDSGRGLNVGDTVRISCNPLEMRVRGTTATRILVDWPWWQSDPGSENPWDGTVGFPIDPDSYEWCNTAWRMEPDGFSLNAGDICIVGVPLAEAVVTDIVNYVPPADFGWLPRPEWAIGLCYHEYLGDESAGFTIYLDSGEPVQIEKVI